MDPNDIVKFAVINPDDTEGIYALFLEFIETSDPKLVCDFWRWCDEKGFIKTGDPIYVPLRTLAMRGDETIIPALVSSSDQQHPYFGIIRTARSFLDFYKFNIKSGEKRLREGLFDLFNKKRLDFADAGLMILNSFMLEDLQWPQEERFPEPPFEILHESPNPDSPYTCCFTCDPVYFKNYAERFITNLREQCGDINIFALMVNGEDDDIERAKAFGGITIARTTYTERWIAEFCICSRFLLANKILQRIDGPVLFMDVDAAFPDGSAEVLQKISRHPLSYSNTGEPCPSLMVDASIIGAHPGDEDARKFFDAAASYMSKNLIRKGPIWMLDQSALYRAVCDAKAKGWRIVEMNDLVDVPMPVFFKQGGHVQSLDERRAIRTTAVYLFDSFAPNKRILIKEKTV